jgi:hypothetical protein
MTESSRDTESYISSNERYSLQLPPFKTQCRKRNKTRSRSRNRKRDTKHNKHIPHRKRSFRDKFPKKKQEKTIYEKRSDSHWRRRTTPHFDWTSRSYIRSYKVIIAQAKISRSKITLRMALLVGAYWSSTNTPENITQQRYAISQPISKVIKPVEKYINSAKEEEDLCHMISKKDSHHWCAKLIECFEYKGHYIMIFEQLGQSLYR